MIELRGKELVISFPEVHRDARCQISFQRTLRIPDDNREYPLPPGLGEFPLEHVDDRAPRLPTAWAEHGGVLLPMYQAEALWISFRGLHSSYPFAVKVAAGKINALTGGKWSNGLTSQPQDYLVVPDQLWLDGFCVRKGLIRQFVAMPLGQGYTAEEQLTGAAKHGGLQITVYPMKPDRYEEMMRKRQEEYDSMPRFSGEISFCLNTSDIEMGIAPGGLMRQEIYEDKYGYEAWEQDVASRCFVHILNSSQWEAATGKAAPGSPPSAADYTSAGLPWFDYYAENLTALDGSKKLSGLDSVAAKGVKLGEALLAENEPVSPSRVIRLWQEPTQVEDGEW